MLLLPPPPCSLLILKVSLTSPRSLSLSLPNLSPMLLKFYLRFNSSLVTVRLVMAHVALVLVFRLFVQLFPLQSPFHHSTPSLQLCADT